MTKQLFSRVSARTFALVTLGAVLAPGAAHATGVTAGTLIQNTASATYTSGASGGTVSSNTVTIKVDELLNVAVAGLTTTPAVVGPNSAVIEYSITNTGNGSEAFKITVNPATATLSSSSTLIVTVFDDTVPPEAPEV